MTLSILKEVPIKFIKTKKPRRLVNVSKPLRSKKPILVKKRGKFFYIINGNHRFYKNLEMGIKKMEVIIKS